MAIKKEYLVQTRNPLTKRYVLINKKTGKILSHKADAGPYDDIPIVEDGSVSAS